MIGDWDVASSSYGQYFETGCAPRCPAVVVEAVEREVHVHMGSQGLGSPLLSSSDDDSLCSL